MQSRLLSVLTAAVVAAGGLTVAFPPSVATAAGVCSGTIQLRDGDGDPVGWIAQQTSTLHQVTTVESDAEHITVIPRLGSDRVDLMVTGAGADWPFLGMVQRFQDPGDIGAESIAYTMLSRASQTPAGAVSQYGTSYWQDLSGGGFSPHQSAIWHVEDDGEVTALWVNALGPARPLTLVSAGALDFLFGVDNVPGFEAWTGLDATALTLHLDPDPGSSCPGAPPADDQPVPTTITLTLDRSRAVSGQQVTATAEVSSHEAMPPTGWVEFTIDGRPVGDPVHLVGGVATSAPFGAAAGDHEVRATYLPKTARNGSSTAYVPLPVERAGTTTELTIRSGVLSARVAPTAPGSGDPTGAVTFAVDGEVVGSASLVDGVASLEGKPLPAGDQDVAAAYAGDHDFEPSSASTALEAPRIATRLRSAAPQRENGWWRRPVTVHYTCAAGTSPLASTCPAPVTVRREGEDIVVRRVVTATDGTSTSSVVSIDLDRTRPEVRLVRREATGALRCVAMDALSGVASCRTATVRLKDGSTRVVARATDRAGNTATAVRVR